MAFLALIGLVREAVCAYDIVARGTSVAAAEAGQVVAYGTELGTRFAERIAAVVAHHFALVAERGVASVATTAVVGAVAAIRA